MRLIDADRLIERLRNAAAFYGHETAGDFDTGRKLGLIEAEEKVAEEPTIEVEPVKHGKWIYGENEDGQDGIFCSECDHFVPWYYDYYDKTDDLINDNPRCPSCGAKMDGGKNER